MLNADATASSTIAPHASGGVARAASDDALGCLHCGQPVGSSDAGAYCCFGCRAVHDALRAAGLERFYALRGARGEPVGERAELGGPGSSGSRDAHALHAARWLEPLEARLAASAVEPLRLSARGVRCAACVWVFEKLFADQPDAGRIILNPSTGALELSVGAGFPLRHYVEQLERFGYRLGPAHGSGADAGAGEGDTLLLRLGICSALALNAMVFAAAGYFGLQQGPLAALLHSLGFAAAMLCVLVGAPVFLGSALAAVRAGVPHLDVPIAVGITLTTTAALWAYLGGHQGAAYYDSLAAFIALMLAGRYLQERVVAKNRSELQRDAGFEALDCQRERAGQLQTVRYDELTRGDVLLLAPGELLPVAGELLDRAASCSLDWINGEPEPRPFELGARVPAGAFNAGPRATRIRIEGDFSASELLPLVEPAVCRVGPVGRLQRFSSFYVSAVLVLAAGGLGAWLLIGGAQQALAVATAVCVVTCPCAIGIAVPLTYQLMHARLRRHGLFVRDGSLLDRLQHVRTVAFDKTGTLTTGRVGIDNPQAVVALSRARRHALHALCVRSLHPRSVAIRRLLEGEAHAHRSELEVEEHPGRGLSAHIDGHDYRLGSGAFCGTRPGQPAQPGQPDPVESSGDGAPAGGATFFTEDGQQLARIETRELLRPDAAREIAALEQRGYRVTVLSGDEQARVRDTARLLGIDPADARGGLSPEDKAALVRAGGADHTLMIGDGINDALAVDAALCSGTPAVERAFLPARTDFHFTSAGLAPIGAALQAARDTAAIVRGNLIFAVLYNGAAVTAALAGLMQPWVAAIVMPLSSILVVARTSAAVAHRSRSWKF